MRPLDRRDRPEEPRHERRPIPRRPRLSAGCAAALLLAAGSARAQPHAGGGGAPAAIDSAALPAPAFSSTFKERICDDQTDKTCPQGAPHWRPVLGSGGSLSKDNRDGGRDTAYADATFKGVLNGALGPRALRELDPFKRTAEGLAITARPTPPALQPAVWGKPWTSGLITSKFLHTFTYGYIEVTADLPVCAKGSWPAVWITPVGAGWPRGGEIDFPEDIGTGKHVFSLHSGASPKGGYHQEFTPPQGCARGFHRYGALKTPSTVGFYYDGAKVAEFPASADMNVPEVIILNLAMGGGWATGASGPPAPHPLTATFKSVKVWSLPLKPGR